MLELELLQIFGFLNKTESLEVYAECFIEEWKLSANNELRI